jgi:hypothetical protein
MVPTSTISPESTAQERQLLSCLLGLYATQQRLYGEVLELSRRQLDLVRGGAPLAEIRGILSAKRSHLEMIARLDSGEAQNRVAWRAGGYRWTAGGRAQMQKALSDVGRSIEEILACEEENDRELVQHCR